MLYVVEMQEAPPPRVKFLVEADCDTEAQRKAISGDVLRTRGEPSCGCRVTTIWHV